MQKMSFTVSDFHDLVEILHAQPAWREELRSLVLTEDILGLPQAVRELVEITKQNQPRFLRYDSDIAELKSDVKVLKEDVAVLKTDVGRLKGSDVERKFRERPFVYFSKLARRIRVVSDAELAVLLESAEEEGRINEDELDEIKLLDAVSRGRSREGGADVYLAVEASSVVDPYDVARVAKRAALLAKATQLVVIPVVAGESILESACEVAVRLGVETHIRP